MKTGFAHFDDSHRENFCAAVLLLTMEVESAVQGAIARLVQSALGIEGECELVAFGREARLAAKDDEAHARVDIWLLFRKPKPFYAFLEVKTHDRWPAKLVAEQVRDQAGRASMATNTHEIVGSVLLAPARLCLEVASVDPNIPKILWPQLLRTLKDISPASKLTQHCITHLEKTVDQPIGIANRPLVGFEDATTTVACLRTFLTACIADIGGTRKNKLNTTPGDGQPLRGGGWAWHGISVPFVAQGGQYYLGIYKYVEAPPGKESYLDTLWLEAYPDGSLVAEPELEFKPSSLSPDELDKVRALFKAKWCERKGT
jgi:hypothetical protein